ncbi:MAG: hypothetical protein KAV42_11475 [Candidatus Krumholzibacteria bacterium]|nr:hypothetical protein [Candidatus Krumholzibacteria bacterium]
MRAWSLLFSVCLTALFVNGCAPSFSELQSAKLVEMNRVEVAANYSMVSFLHEGENEKMQDHFGLQFAYGVLDNVNFRFRYERIDVDPLDTGVNAWGFGPKICLKKDVAAIYLPVGFATGENIETSESWQFHPTLLTTAPVNEYMELNTSFKYLLTFDEDSNDYFAFNLGLGLSNDLARYAIRPEVGILIDPGSDGIFWHFSVGLSLFL